MKEERIFLFCPNEVLPPIPERNFAVRRKLSEDPKSPLLWGKENNRF